MTKIISIKPIDFNDKKAITKEIENFIKKYAYADIEHALEISPNGNAYNLTGTKYNVNSEIIGKDALKGSISIHNHPIPNGQIQGDSFSIKDLCFSVENTQSKQYLISGERRNAFEFKKIYNETEIYRAWKEAYALLLFQARLGQVDIVDEQEQILKILNELLEGFDFYENF